MATRAVVGSLRQSDSGASLLSHAGLVVLAIFTVVYAATVSAQDMPANGVPVIEKHEIKGTSSSWDLESMKKNDNNFWVVTCKQTLGCIEDPGRLADLVASNIGLKTDQSQEILEMIDPVQRLKRVSELLAREIELLTVQQKIQSEARGEIDKTQREYFLREQLKAIQKELGDMDERAEEINEFRKKIEEAKMPEKVLKEAEKQLKRIEKMHPDSAEAATVRTYLDWLVELPWSKSTTDNLDIKSADKVMNEDHYDLEKVKERILEYLSVRKLKEKMKGPLRDLWVVRQRERRRSLHSDDQRHDGHEHRVRDGLHRYRDARGRGGQDLRRVRRYRGVA